MRTLLTAAAVLVMGLFARNAEADIVNCFDVTGQCAPTLFISTGGGGPYVYVKNSLGDFLDLTTPTQINYSYNGPGQNGQPVNMTAAGSLPTGIVQLTNQLLMVNAPEEELGIFTRDFYTLNGPSSDSVAITAQFTVNGTAAFPAVNPYGSGYTVGGSVFMNVCSDTYNASGFRCAQDQFDDRAFTGFGAYYPGYSGPVTLAAIFSWNVPVGVPFAVSTGMDTDVGGQSLIDLTDPGTLSFLLPAGYSITSQGGFSNVQQSAVPEPSSAVLLGLALIMIGWRRRVR